MKLLLNIMIMVVHMCASEKSAYDWRLRTIEQDSDFGDDLKVQTALNNERQQDLLKNFAKTNNYEDYEYYNPFNKNINDKSNYTIDSMENNYTGDIMENGQHLSNNKIDSKYEKKTNFQSNGDQNNKLTLEQNFKTDNPGDQNNKFTLEQNFKTDNPSDYGNGNDNDKDNDGYDYDFKVDHQNNFITKHNGKLNYHPRPLYKELYKELYKNNHEHFLKNLLSHNYNYIDYRVGEKNNEVQDDKNLPKTANTHCSTGTKTEDIDRTEDVTVKECTGTKDQTENIGIVNFEVIGEEKENVKENVKDNEKKLNDKPYAENSKSQIDSFVGTNLFDSTKKCFATEDVALLVARRDFESLIPKDLPQKLLDDETVALLIKYFYVCHETVIRTTSAGYRNLAQKAFYDTLGGYLNFYLVPVTKYSFYAGHICLSSAQQVLMLHQESKRILNTNGNGWKVPPHNVLVELKSAHIEPLSIPQSNEKRDIEPSFCMHLDMNNNENRQNNDNMIVQLPKLETENANGFLGNVVLPFKRKRNFDLKSERSAYIVVKFYETVTKCYRYENINQDSYNDKFKTWLLENVNVHLSDDQFYPGLGAVLRIYEYLRKGSSKNKDTIGISKDVRVIENEKHLHNKKRTNYDDQIKEMQVDPKKIIDEVLSVLRQPKPIKLQLPKAFVDPKTQAITGKDNKTVAAVPPVSTDSKPIVRYKFDYTPSQIAIVAVPAVIIFLIIIVCCCKCCRRKRNLAPGPKHSSSSSSNLFNSPARFFYVKRQSDYSSIEGGNKNNKKSVKIDKKRMVNSDSSASSSPVRNKKSKNGKGKDSGKK